MNREHDNGGGGDGNDRRQPRGPSEPGTFFVWIARIFFAIWLLGGITVISFIVGFLFHVSFGSAFLGVAGALAAVLAATLIANSRKRTRPPARTPVRNASSGRATVSIAAVVGVMIMFLTFDFLLTLLLDWFGVNVILAHFLIIGSGIVLSGATSFISERAPTISFWSAGGVFTSFLLLAMLVFSRFEGNPERSAAANAVIEVLLLLFFAALLFLCSFVVVAQSTRDEAGGSES